MARIKTLRAIVLGAVLFDCTPSALLASGGDKWQRLNKDDSMRLYIFAFALLVAMNTHAAERVALVIGNASYADAPLLNPVNDARAIDKRLTELGFRVTRLENASRDQMASAIIDFGASLGPNTAGLFYYAGHGIQARGRNYLIPAKTNMSSERDVRARAVEIDDVLEEIRLAGNRVNFVILDACRDNPFEQRTRGGSRGLAPVQAASGTLIAYATKPGAVASDGDGKNGTYTAAFLKALDEPGLNEDQLFKRVAALVESKTRGEQTPWREGSLKGDFVFNINAPSTITVQPAQSANERTVEVAYWNSISNSDNPADFKAYLADYPEGRFARLARNRLAALKKPAPKVPLANPKPAAPVVDADAEKRSRIEALLKSAVLDVKALRLTSPKASNAVDKYNEVLSIDRDNQEAIAGLGDVVTAYIKMAEQSANRGNKASAKRYLDRAESVQESEAIEAARDRLLASSAQAKLKSLRSGQEATVPPPTGQGAFGPDSDLTFEGTVVVEYGQNCYSSKARITRRAGEWSGDVEGKRMVEVQVDGSQIRFTALGISLGGTPIDIEAKVIGGQIVGPWEFDGYCSGYVQLTKTKH